MVQKFHKYIYWFPILAIISNIHKKKLWLNTFHSIFTQWMSNYGTQCPKYIDWIHMLAIFSNMHHMNLWFKTNCSAWSIIFLQKIVIIGATIQKATLRQSSRPMIDKLSWKGELIQFELHESISTQPNAHHYKCEVKVTSISFTRWNFKIHFTT